MRDPNRGAFWRETTGRRRFDCSKMHIWVSYGAIESHPYFSSWGSSDGFVRRKSRRGRKIDRKCEKDSSFFRGRLEHRIRNPRFSKSGGGCGAGMDPSDFLYDKFMANEKARIAYWRMSIEAYAVMKAASPNPAYHSIRSIEEMGKLLAVVTQNIDRLHHRAGTSPEKIVELHGNAFEVKCQHCHRYYDREAVGKNESETARRHRNATYARVLSKQRPFPSVRPCRRTKWSGPSVTPGNAIFASFSALRWWCIPQRPYRLTPFENGAKLIIVNRTGTPLDSRADLVCHEEISQALGAMVDRIRTEADQERTLTVGPSTDNRHSGSRC